MQASKRKAKGRSKGKQVQRGWRSWRTSSQHTSFDEAVKDHAMVKAAVDKFVAAKQQAGDQPLRDAWLALRGEWPEDQSSYVADSIGWTVPAGMIPLLRWQDSIAAAFAICMIADELEKVDLGDDLEVRQAIRKAWQRFEERRLQANEVEEGFGCDKSESWHTLRRIVDAVDREAEPRIMAIAQLAGRMYKVMRANMLPTRTDDPQEVKEATVGGNVERLLASEFALLANPSTANATAIKILERRALEYKYQGVSTMGRGPMVLCIDESGSMHDAYYGYRGRNTWAKACAVALTRIAWQENRAVKSVHFGTGTVARDLKQNDREALFEMASSFLSGGTDFGNALRRSLKEVGNLKSEGFDGADIVLITDGEDGDHASHNKVLDDMDANGVRLWTVGIGIDIRASNPVVARAAHYVYANDAELGQRNAERMALGLQGAAAQNPKNVN